MTGVADFDTLRPPILDLDVALGTSVVGGSLVDELSGRVRMADGTLVVDSARGRAIGTLLVGHGRLPVTGEGGDSLVFTLTADDLAAVGALTRELAGLGSDTLGGQAAGRVVVTGSLERPQVAWRMASRRIGWNGLVIHGARAEGRWRTGDTALAAQFEVDSVRSGERSYRRLLAAAAGRGKAFRWIASGEIGPWAGFRAGGAFARGDSVALRFDSLALFAAGDEWRLPSGARLVATKEALALENLRLATTDGARLVAFDGALPRGGAGTLTGTVEALAVRDLWALFQYNPQSAAGELSGTFTVSGSGSAPLIQASFELRDAVFNEYRSPLINGTLHYGDRRLTGELNTFRVGTQIVSVDLSLPVDLAFRPLARRRLPGPLVVRAHAEQVDLSLLSAVSPLVRETEGLMSLDLGLEGTWDAPELDGWLEIENGAVTFPAIGVRHRELRGRVSLSGDSIRVDSLSARSGTGAASVAGVVRLEGLSRPVLDLRVRARDFRALDVPGFLTLVTSGEVRLQGPVFGATLTGAGTIPRGVIYFADIVQKEVVSLSDTLLAMDSATARLVREAHLGPNFENRFLDGLRVENLELTMGGDVHLRSTEADIFLTGRVLVQKQADRYRLDGTLETPRGTYQLDVGPTIRKQFTVTRGEVRYFGTPDLNATLDIDARHQLRGQGGENVAVFVHVGGTLLAPELRLTSDVQPPLTNEEIISYLVIGAPNVQAGQGVVGYGARESFSTLTAQISGQLSSRLMADLGVPLDYLEIRPQLGVQGVERTAVDIVAGRQIGDRWFLRLNPRICSRQAISAENIGGSIEFRIARDWGLLASADPVEVCRITTAGRLQLGLDVLWELRF
jgi:autotransporter translocation and assembly factor TamB